MDQAVVFVGPCGVSEDALDGEIDFDGGLFFADARREPMRESRRGAGSCFRQCSREPARDCAREVLAHPDGVARGFNCVANVFAIAERRFAEQFAVAPVNRERVAGVGPRLLAADVLLHCAVDIRRTGVPTPVSADIPSRLSGSLPGPQVRGTGGFAEQRAACAATSA